LSGGNTVPDVVYALQANGIDRADTAGCNGCGWRADEMYTLNTIDKHAVAYSFDSMASNSMKSSNPHSGCRAVECAKTIDTSDQNPSKNQGGIAIVYDCRGNGDGNTCCTLSGDHDNRVTDYTNCVVEGFVPTGFAQYKRGNPTLRASGADIGGGSEALILENKLPRKYIVRRLTPIECARLQGFPDYWGHVPKKGGLTPEEIEFWQHVRKTYSVINGKSYTPQKSESLLNWYNKLHTDSSEYKMWGNGIALPCAVFILKNIKKFTETY